MTRDGRRFTVGKAARSPSWPWRSPRHQPNIRADEDTIELRQRLAVHYDDVTIAGILNRQGRRSATGERFTTIIVGGLRRYRNIPTHQPPAEPLELDGELLPVGEAAEQLGVAASTLFRWLQAGLIAGEQDTTGRTPFIGPADLGPCLWTGFVRALAA